MTARVLLRDDGYAMAVVMGAIALITVIVLGSYFVASQALHDSGRVQNESKAFTVAQSGLDRELAGFSPASLVGGHYTKEGSTPDGEYVVNVDELGANEYRLVSLGFHHETSETVTVRFFHLNLWDMSMGAGDAAGGIGGGAGWNGNAAYHGPLYIKGDMEWTANAAYTGGPLFIKGGDLIMTGNGTVGTNMERVRLYLDGDIGGNNPENATKYTIRSYSVPDIDLEWIDADYMSERLAEAREQSVDNIMGDPEQRTLVNTEATAGDPLSYTTVVPGRVKAPGATDHYKYINGNLTFPVTPFGEWDRPGSVYAGTGLHDDFAWDPASGILYVEGVVFVDGSVTFGSLVKGYKGNGLIVATGDITIDGTDLVPVDGVVTGEQCLGLSTPGDVNLRGDFMGAIFCNGVAELQMPGTTVEGSILAGELAGTHPNLEIRNIVGLSESLPAGMPSMGSFTAVGHWSRQ